MSNAKVKITPKDFRLSSGFLNLPKCALWKALERTYPNWEITNVSTHLVRTNTGGVRRDYKVPDEWGSYNGLYSIDWIEQWTLDAQAFKETPTIELELEFIPEK